MATRKSSRIAAKRKPLLKELPRTPENGEQGVQCSICLGDIVFRGRLSVCKHRFCYACILEWSKVYSQKCGGINALYYVLLFVEHQHVPALQEKIPLYHESKIRHITVHISLFVLDILYINETYILSVNIGT